MEASFTDVVADGESGKQSKNSLRKSKRLQARAASSQPSTVEPLVPVPTTPVEPSLVEGVEIKKETPSPIEEDDSLDGLIEHDDDLMPGDGSGYDDVDSNVDEDDADASDDDGEADDDLTSKNKTAVIHLNKGLTDTQIKAFIIKIDAQLSETCPKEVKVVTNEWSKDPRPFPLIIAAKKLFEKYGDEGLIGCLLAHGLHQAAREVYCIGHIKAKTVGDNLVFANIDANHFRDVSMRSATKFLHLKAGSMKLKAPVVKSPSVPPTAKEVPKVPVMGGEGNQDKSFLNDDAGREVARRMFASAAAASAPKK
jgi:hypothetical protein